MQKSSGETHSVGEKTDGVYYKVKWAVSQDVKVDSGQRDHCGRKHSKDETEHLGGLEDDREGKSSQGVRVNSGHEDPCSNLHFQACFIKCLKVSETKYFLKGIFSSR